MEKQPLAKDLVAVDRDTSQRLLGNAKIDIEETLGYYSDPKFDSSKWEAALAAIEAVLLELTETEKPVEERV